MYYFLGLVTDRNLSIGKIKPSFVLASFEQRIPTRAPWRVVRTGSTFERMPRVLATSLIGNDLMIDFMTYWRAIVPPKQGQKRKTRSGEKIRYRKFIKGALFFFECDRYGNRCGRSIFIKRVPDRSGRDKDDNYRHYTASLLAEKNLSDSFFAAPLGDKLLSTGVKPIAIQVSRDSKDLKNQRKWYINKAKERCADGKKQLNTRRRVPDTENDQRK